MAPQIRAKKLFLGVRDNNNFDRRQFSILTLLTDGDELFTNQYAKMFTEDEIGSFDVRKVDDLALLEFVALDSRVNYAYSFISYDTKQNIFDSDSFNLGNTVSIATTNKLLSIGTTENTVFSIPSDITSGKLLIESSSQSSSTYEYNEINFVSTLDIDSNVYFTEFGKLTVSDDYPSGIGTYGITSNGDVTFSPTINEELRTNVIAVSIANSSFTAVSSQNLRYANVESIRVSIEATESPEPVSVSQYAATFNSAYYVVQIVGFNTVTQEKTTQLIELASVNNEIDATLIQYGEVTVGEELGTFDVNAATLVDLFFTPVENTDIDLTILRHTVTYTDFNTFPASINFGNAELTTGVTVFNQSGDVSLKKDFDLTHKGISVFERRFNGSLDAASNAVGVDLVEDLIYLPNHYFVTGEKVSYKSGGVEFVELFDTAVTETAGIGTDIVTVDSVFSLQVNDFFEGNGTGKLSITGIGSTSITLETALDAQINAGAAVTFFRLIPSNISESTFNSIGIAQTFIAGVGNTDKLSGDLYIYKKDELFLGFGTSPLDVTKRPPKLIDLTSVGSGNDHYIISRNQNSKCLIAIDNMIQSPIVSTSTTTILTDSLDFIDTTVSVSSNKNFAAGDLLKIDDEVMKISSVGVGTTSNQFEVIRPFMGTFISQHSSSSIVTKLTGNYNIIASKIYFAEAPYGPIFDEIKGNVNIRSSFQGRSFMRSINPALNEETYQYNYVFDNLEDQFNSSDKNFTLTSSNQSITEIENLNSISLINGIFQNPSEDYNLVEDSVDTKIQFTGTATSIAYDINNGSIPRGGMPISIGSTEGFGYQPLISAGGTAIVGLGGTIQSISIGYSGSGYRVGIQTIVNVGVQTASTGTPNIEFIGTATVSNGNVVGVNITNPGSGYDPLNPPEVVFDEPFSYTNLDLIYQSPSTGIGTEAKIDIVVGRESSIIDFNIKNYGYSFSPGDILTVLVGGTTGIQTVPSVAFKPFSIIIDKIRTDEFSGWTIGELEKLDDLDSLANGFERIFPISRDNNRIAILAKEGSLIDLSAVLVIFVNDVLQEPNVAYKFTDGGSLIEFTEPLPANCKCRIYFYKGTPNIDVIDVDVLETVQNGDTLQIIGDRLSLTQESRLVKDVFLADTVKTNNYNTVGVSSNRELLRPVTWCKQRNDTLIDGIYVSKSRNSYEPNIYPVANIIQPVSTSSTIFYVDNIRAIFNQSIENVSKQYTNSIQLIDTSSERVGASATAIVNSQGQIQNISITNSGQGYSQVPGVSISYPQSGIITNRATATSTLSGDSLNNITITNSGAGYSSTNPPKVIIDPPAVKSDIVNNNVSYSGDFGIVSSVIKVGTSSTELLINLYIPQDSILRDLTYTKISDSSPIPFVESEIEVGDFVKITTSIPISGGESATPIVSRDINDNIIGIATTTATGISNVYQVASVTTENENIFGLVNEPVKQIKVFVTTNNNVATATSEYYGDYSWGKVEIPEDSLLNNYNYSDLSNTPTVRRTNPLKYDSYGE